MPIMPTELRKPTDLRDERYPHLTEPVLNAITGIAGAAGSWCPALSPDGRRVAYVTDRTGRPELEVADLDGPATRISGPGQEVISVSWSPDGEWLAYLVSPGGLLRAELHAVRPDGSGHRLLDGAGEFETVFAGSWTTDGRYVYTLADGVSPDATVRSVDPSGGPGVAPRRLPVGDALGFCVVTGTSADTRRILVRAGTRNRRRIWLLPGWDENGAQLPGEPVRLLAANFPDLVDDTGEDGRFAPDGAAVYLRSSAGLDRMRLIRVPLDPEGRPGPFETVAARTDADLDFYAVQADGSLVLVWNEGGESCCQVVDSASDRVDDLALPGRVLTGWSQVGDTFVVETSGPSQPRSLHLATPSGPVVVAAPASPTLPPGLVAPTHTSYSAPDGTEIHALLYRPSTAATGAAVVSLHGGPESQERPAFSLLTQSLLAAGITVLAPNVRGSTGYGARFTASDDGAGRPSSFGDVAAAAAHLVVLGVGTPGRIGVQGWSYGGYLVMTSLVRYRGLFAAAMTHAGMSDLTSFFAETEPWMAAASTTEYGDPVTESTLLQELSPLPALSTVRTPTLFVHGDRDTNVPTAESVRGHRALVDAGTPTSLLLLPGEGHTIVGADHRVEMAMCVADWFTRWLAAPGADDD